MSARAWTRLIMIGGICAVWAYLILVPPAALPFAPTNGTYTNPCCAQSITLADGKLFVGGKWAANYVINAHGNPYLAPDAWVHIDAGIVVVDRKANPIFIHFVWNGRPETARSAYTSAGVDKTTAPTGLELFSESGNYVFEREGSRPR